MNKQHIPPIRQSTKPTARITFTTFKTFTVTLEDFLRAADLLEDVGDYEDSAELLKEAKYCAAKICNLLFICLICKCAKARREAGKIEITSEMDIVKVK